MCQCRFNNYHKSTSVIGDERVKLCTCCGLPRWLRRYSLPAVRETQVHISGSGRSPGEGNGNSLQYSCLENPVDGGAWQATVHRVAKSWTQLSDLKKKKKHVLYLIPLHPLPVVL